ncbi:hypothetical protein L208DRAFT_1492924, partial [Tricholoma matsutake]
YISIFLPTLAEYTSILTPLTTKECDKIFPEWMSEHQFAFEHIKKLVLGVDCLTVIDYDDPTSSIYVTTDVSNHQTGAVLSFRKLLEEDGKDTILTMTDLLGADI